MSRITRFTRLMHTSGRQIPNPGQGGAPQIGTTSPTPHSHHPLPPKTISEPDPDISLLRRDLSLSEVRSSPFPKAPKPLLKYTPKGKPIPHRPARTTKVHLASGYPEPDSYPVSESYFVNLESKRKAPHPLWQFFHVSPESQQPLKVDTAYPVDSGSLEALEGDESNLKSGRSWSAIELRQRSFADLHALWYVLLKERNVLATQREERRRLNISAGEGGDLITKRAFRCRKSMARIKYVLNERRLGLLAAATPHLPEAPHIPFSASSSSDPFAGIPALSNTAEIPTWIQAGPSGQEVAEEGESLFEDDNDAVVEDSEVAKEEVESRDEGFGGGKEARQFVEDVKVEDGHVVKK